MQNSKNQEEKKKFETTTQSAPSSELPEISISKGNDWFDGNEWGEEMKCEFEIPTVFISGLSQTMIEDITFS